MLAVEPVQNTDPREKHPEEITVETSGHIDEETEMETQEMPAEDLSADELYDEE